MARTTAICSKRVSATELNLPVRGLNPPTEETRRACLGDLCANDNAQAFTRVELMVVLGALAMLALLAVPALASGKTTSQRAVCASNLARVGRALALWGTERGDLYPWQVQASVGGTFNHPSGLNNNSWFQFAWISNELVSPKVLACPSDRLVKIPQSFAFAPDGFLDAHYQNNAISYTLSHPFPEDGRLVLSSDRSMRLDGGAGAGCGYFGSPIAVSVSASNSLWMDFMHMKSGNLLFSDGSVEQTDNEGLGKAMGPYKTMGEGTDRQSYPHFRYPRPPGLISETEN